MSHCGRVEGRRIVITGGASGIGLETARLFLQQGARVALLDSNPEAVQAAARELAVPARVVDVTREEAAGAAVNSVVAELGGVDGLVNAAGISDRAHFADLPLSRWARVIEVNLTGAFVMCGAILSHMRGGGSRTIVNVASGIGLRPFLPGQTAYAASKGGLIAFTKALAIELSPDIRVNAVCPGLVDTPMTRAGELKPGDPRLKAYPIGRVAQAGEIAQAILFLTCDESSYVVGSALVVDGGRAMG